MTGMSDLREIQFNNSMYADNTIVLQLLTTSQFAVARNRRATLNFSFAVI
jgi:hypothetical protein